MRAPATNLDDVFGAAIQRAVRVELDQLRTELPALLEDAVEHVLERRAVDGLVGLAGLAELIGAPSADAARHRLKKDLGLAALAVPQNGSGQRRWLRSAVLRLMAERASGGR